MKDPILSMLSLAQKAGKVVSGEFATEKAIKEGSAYLIIVAEDASDNTKKRFFNMCEYHECDLMFYSTREMLGWAIGKEFRASLALCDENFAEALKRKYDPETTME